MPKLPVVRPRDLVKILQRHGFVPQRQKGSHLIMINSHNKLVVIPMHNKPLKKGTLKSILRQSEIRPQDL